MSWKRWAAAAVVSMQLPAVTLAKPADLPVDQRINYASEGQSPRPSEQEPVPEFDEHVVRPAPDDPRVVDLFQRGERQRQSGQLREARRSYEEVHIQAPMSRVGQKAIQRLNEMESPRNDFSEEQEPPLFHQSLRPNYDSRPTNSRPEPMPSFLDMLRRTKPLEMAPVERVY